MSRDDVTELMNAEPFEPFEITTLTGKRYLVEFPEQIAGFTYTMVIIGQKKIGHKAYDHFVHLGLSAIHDGGHVYTQPTYDARQDKQLPHAEHPIVRTHPVTGRKALFVDRGFTTRIVGLPADEGAAILEYLLRHLEQPEFQCRFHWEADSIALWDNRCAQHRAIYDYHPHRRYGHRVTIRGDRPFYRG